MANPVSESESERRLRPVIDALYNHSSKQALKLIHQALQKRQGWPAARALRACVYVQTERLDEAAQEMTALRADLDAGLVPLDEDAAKKMYMYYNETRDDATAAIIYEQAWLVDRNNFRLADTAFGLHIRGGSFSAAQKLATKLHRIASSATQKYAVMAASALWLDITVAARDKASVNPDTRMLKLGSAMLSKALTSVKAAPSAETVRFAVRVFKDALDYDAAEKLMSHPNLVIGEVELLIMRANIAFHRKSDPTHYRELLTLHTPNDWGHWLRFFECIKGNENWTDEASALIESLSENSSSSGEPLRGPFLAKMELRLRVSDFEGLGEAMADYFRMFGSKIVSSRDLRPYLIILKDSNAQIFNHVLSEFTAISDSEKARYLLSLCWLRLYAGKLTETPEQLIAWYNDLKVENLSPTDRQPGDDFLLIAAHRVLPDLRPDSNNRYGDKLAVVQAIMILEAGLTESPFNVDFKLLLMHLYTVLGGMERVAALWESLDIKHVQLSTLTHLVLRPFFETGHHEALRDVLVNIDTLWRECDREIPECTTRAYMNGSTNAATEFVLFRMRLSRSIILAEAMVIEALMNLVAAHSEPIGTQRALSTLTYLPRFTAEDLHESKSIICNDDTQCLEFWNVHGYKPDCRLDALKEEVVEEGVECEPARKQGVATDLKSLLLLLRLSEETVEKRVTKTNGATADGNGREVGHVNGNGCVVESSSMLRINIAKNLHEVKELLLLVASGALASDTTGTGISRANVDEVLQTAQNLTEEMMRKVRGIVERNGTGGEQEGTMRPESLRECGKFVYETVLVVSVATSLIRPSLSKGPKRVKKASGKGEDKDAGAGRVLEKAREAIAVYRNGLLATCATIQEWFAACIDTDADWTRTIFEDQDMSQVLRVVPERVHMVELEHGTKVADGEMDRDEFCRWVRESIKTGHTVTCAELIETLKCITNRLKLSEF